MSARAAPSFGAVLGLALLGAGTGHALSLRSSAAESFLGDASPGTTVVFSRATGAKLRVENSGRDAARLEFKIVPPPAEGLKDGFDPWPYLDRVRATSSRANLGPGEGADVELAVTVPKDSALIGGQYQFDVLATGYDPAGASLTLRTRVLLSIGAPLATADAPAGGFAERPGFTLTPRGAELEKVPWAADKDPGDDATFKIVNAGDEDLTVTLSPARDWDDGEARLKDGYDPAPNPRWLRFDPGVVKIRAGAIGRARIGASIPRQTRYAGRRLAFVVAADAVAGGRRTRRYFVLYAVTRDLEEDTRAR
jgi:hypothetical protein